jgi:hypothetical protein
LPTDAGCGARFRGAGGFAAGMRPSTARALAPNLDEQHDVIAGWQIVAAGCDHEVAAREIAAGRWQQPAPRVYFAFAGEPSHVQRGWCAQLVGGRNSVISGPLACHLLGVPDAGPLTAVALVSAACQRRGTDDYVVRRSKRLAPWTDMDGVRVAGPARAVLDACRVLPTLQDVRAVVSAALNAKHTSYDELLCEYRAEYRDGLAGMGHALEDWSDGARSAPEAEVADVLREEVRAKRLPPFLLNPNIYDGALLVGAADVYVPGCSLGAETDSQRHHGSPDDLDKTLTRHTTFTNVGIRLEHITPTRFRQSPRAWAALFALIAEQRRGLGDPAGLRIEPIGPLQPVRGRRRR